MESVDSAPIPNFIFFSSSLKILFIKVIWHIGASVRTSTFCTFYHIEFGFSIVIDEYPLLFRFSFCFGLGIYAMLLRVSSLLPEKDRESLQYFSK